jgi:beta-glucanase (GH16 family)
MHLRRNTLGLAAISLLAAAVPAGAASLPGRTMPTSAYAHSAAGTQMLSEKVKSNGVYDVTVAVATHSSTSVNLTIDQIARHAVTSKKTHRANVKAQVTIRNERLTIRANAKLAATTISASWRKVSPLPLGTTTGSSGGSKSGSTGSTGSTDTAGTANPTTPSGGFATTPVTPPATGSTAPTSGPPGALSSWTPIIDDNFSEGLNSSIWNTSRYDGGGISAGFNSSEQECLDPAHTTFGTIASDEADLGIVNESESCGGTTQPYAGSVLDTDGKFTYTYGYVEAKVWLPGANGTISDWPAIWAVGSNWPTGGEIDILEGLGGEPCWHFHYGTPSSPQTQGQCVAGDYTGGWHTFGADWEPGSITWYYDGQEVGTVTSDVTSSPMQLILDLAVEPGDPVTVPATLRVAYVKLWQHAS